MSLLAPILGLLGVSGVGIALAFIPGAGAIAGKAVSGAISFLSGIPWTKVWWLILVIPAVAFGLIEMRGKSRAEEQAAGWKHKAEDSHRAFLLEKDQFAIEKTSLDSARREIGENNRSIAAQASDLEQARKASAAADVRNAKLAQSSDAQIAGLRVAAGRHSVPCTLSNEAKRELENQ